MVSTYYKVISHCPLFKQMGEKDIIGLLKCLTVKLCEYKKNDYVAITGAPFEGIGIVLKGQVSVSKENAAGVRVMMTVLAPGEMFGEMVAFSKHAAWPATVQALKNSQVLFLSSDKLVNTCTTVCSRHNAVIRNMLEIISTRALLLNKKVEYLTIKSMRGKISTYLLEQYNKSGKMTFMLPLKRNELAEFLNVSRPSMSREMARMRDEQIIDFNMASIKILDLARLKKTLE